MNDVVTPLPRAKRFEELIAWRKARRLTSQIYRLTRETSLGRDFGLRDQMCRSATSAMSNIAEGFERLGPREFRQFLSIAKGSAGELRSQLYVALDARHITPEQFGALQRDAQELCRVIGGLHAAVSRRC